MEWSIHEITKLPGTTSRTLRHYGQLGLSLPAIADVLTGAQDVTHALRTHLALLEQERDRVQRQIVSVRRTIEKKEGGEQLMAEEMFDGFDHTQHKGEVEVRWGQEAYAAGDRWWRGMSAEERRTWQDWSARLIADWIAAAGKGVAPESDEAQALAQRHIEWLGTAPGNGSAGPAKEYVLGLGEMYVSDSRFAATYGGDEKASFVRDALQVFADRHL